MRIGTQDLIDKNLDQMGLAQKLITSLENRKSQLLKHPAMLCAVFLDPRFYYDLTEDEKHFARLNLKQVWKRIAQFKTHNDTPENGDAVDSLEKYLAEKCGPLTAIKNDDKPNFHINITDFMKYVEEYENDLPRIHHSASILDYWSSRINESKHIKNSLELQYVACTIQAVPSTQVPCERSFSVMKAVFDTKRAAINTDLMQAILFIRLNREMYEKIKSQELQSYDSKRKI